MCVASKLTPSAVLPLKVLRGAIRTAYALAQALTPSTLAFTVRLFIERALIEGGTNFSLRI